VPRPAPSSATSAVALKGQAIRIRLNRPQMPSLESDPRGGGIEWTLTFADRVAAPPLPLMVLRNITDRALPMSACRCRTRPVVQTGRSRRRRYAAGGHRAAAGPRLHQAADFVELSLLDPSRRGGASESDDISAEVGSDKVMLGGRATDIVIGRRRRRTRHRGGAAAVRPAIEWRKNQEENFLPRLDALIRAAGTAEPEQKTLARLDLANFYMARAMYQEARGHQPDLSETKQGSEEAAVMMVHAVASILIGHPDRGLKDLAIRRSQRL